jgi:hypothetical protein
MNDQAILGMTVNERLHYFNLFASFERAVKSGDLPALTGVLLQAQLSREQADETARSVLDDPGRYGY